MISPAFLVGVLHTLVVAATPAPELPNAVCRIDHPGHASAELTLEMAWDEWPELCQALGDYLALPAAPLKHKNVFASVRALRALGFFSDVVCSLRDGDEVLACTLQPEKLVHHFQLDGKVPFALLRSDVRRRIFLRAGTLLDKPEEQRVRQHKRLEAYLDDEGYFGTHVDVKFDDEPGVEPNEGVRVHVNVQPGEAATVRHVTISGDPNVPKKDVCNAFRHWWFIGVPQRFRPAQFSDDVRGATELLQEKGWPAAHVAGKFTHDPNANKVDIELEVVPGPRIKLMFTGNKAISSGTLEDLAPFRTAGAVDTVAIEDMRAQMVTAYQRKGYYLVNVTTDVRRPSEDMWNITFSVDEGPRTRVTQVTLTGNKAIDSADIARNADMLTEESGVFNHPWVDSWVKHDIAVLQAYYHKKGFPNAHVEANPKVLKADAIEAVFTIDEGQRVLAKSTLVEGMPDDVPEKSRPKLRMHAGEPLVDDTLDHDTQDLQTALASRGYIQADIESEVKDGAVTYRIDPGVQTHAGGLFLRGNFATRASVLRNEVPVKPGDTLDLPTLGASRRNLRALNVFNTVDLRPLTVYPDIPLTWMLLALEERDVQSLDAVLSFSSDDWFQIGADYADGNLFGRANSFTLQVRFSDAANWIPKVRIGNEDRAEAKLHVARPFGWPFDADGALLYDYQDLQLYRMRRAGGTASISKVLLAANKCPLCPTITGKLGYELIETYFVYKDITNENAADEAAALQALAALSIPNQTIARLIPSLSIDKRDSPIDPHSGYRWDGRVDVAIPQFAGFFYKDASAFWRLITSVQGYLNLGTPLTRRVDENRRVGGPVIAALSLQYSAAGPWTAHGYVPLSEAYTYGGDFSVRGLIADASAVAVPDAHYMVVGSFELRWYAIPDLGFGTIQVGAFTDLGSVSASLDDLLHTNTLSVGPLLRYVTPVGPLSLAYGWAVVRPLAIAGPQPDAIPAHGRLHFTFGYSF